MTAEIKSTRRYYLLKRLYARRLAEDSERIWQAKQEAEPGTLLPAAFPHRAELAAVGYTTAADLDGADADELTETVGLSTREADAVIAAFEAL